VGLAYPKRIAAVLEADVSDGDGSCPIDRRRSLWCHRISFFIIAAHELFLVLQR
jgi:hypothetical protein